MAHYRRTLDGRRVKQTGGGEPTKNRPSWFSKTYPHGDREVLPEFLATYRDGTGWTPGGWTETPAPTQEPTR